MPHRVRASSGEVFAVDAAWHARLESLADQFATSDGDLLTVPVALDSCEAKAAAAAGGAVAVDMESAAVAAVATRVGAPFVVLRVIVDTRGDALPTDTGQWLDERGNRRLAGPLRAVASPTQWRALWTLARRYRVASGALARLARLAVAQQLLVPPPGGH
jgi:hypothetical protein